MHQSTVPTRLSLDGLSINIEPFEDKVHMDFVDPSMWVHGISISRPEARRLASALLDASAPSFGGSPLKEIEEHVAVARKNTIAMSPAKCCKAQKEFAKLDLPELARGTVLDLFHAARKVGISPSDLLRQLDLEEDAS